VAQAALPQTRAGSDFKPPNRLQSILLDVPFGDDICAITARGTGKSWCIPLLTTRDAQYFKKKYSCLIVRQTYQGLTELQGLLWRYYSSAFPGTTWSGADMTFRLGGKSEPFGRVELGYTGTGAIEANKALTRYQGRSFVCCIVDEVGAHTNLEFCDTIRATLRAPNKIPTRMILLGNPGGPCHASLQTRYGIPAGYPEPGKPVRFYSEDLQKWCVFLTATAASNHYIDLDAYIRSLRVACGDDPALLDSWLRGRLDVDVAGSFFGNSFSVKRSLRDIKPGDIKLREHKPFVMFDYGVAAPSVFYLCLPDPPDAPRGSLLLLDELYICATTSGGQREWTRGSYLSTYEQASAIAEWLEPWGLRPNDIPVLADDAIFNNDGRPRGSVAGDFKDAGVNVKRAGKMNTRMDNGLSMMRNMLTAAGKDPGSPWLQWTHACAGLMATLPTLPRHPTNPEVIAPGCADHACDAARYALTYNRSRSLVGTTSFQLW